MRTPGFVQWLGSLSSGRVFLGLLVLSALARLTSAFYLGSTVEILPGTHDQVSYDSLAARVVGGHGFTFGTDWWPATRAGEPTAHWSYLYTLYLTLVYWIVGLNPLIARIIQALVVSFLHPWFTWRIGTRLFGETTGLIAAGLVAVYGYFVYYAGALMTESFYIVSILWSLDMALRVSAKSFERRRVSGKDWFLLGLALGTTVLLRQVFLFFVPILLGWVFFAYRWGERRSLGYYRGVLTVGVVLILMIAPWSLRNYKAFGQFVLLNTNAGFAFFWGNHPIHGKSFIPILRDEDPSYGSLIPAHLRELDEASMDKALLKEGVGFVLQDPLRYAILSLSRFKEFFKFWPSSESGLASNIVRVLSFGMLSPFMLLGVIIVLYSIVGRREWWKLDRTNVLVHGHVLLLLFISYYTVMHLLSWTLVRYRLPVDAVLVLFGGVGIVWLANQLLPLSVWSPRSLLRTSPPDC